MYRFQASGLKSEGSVPCVGRIYSIVFRTNKIFNSTLKVLYFINNISLKLGISTLTIPVVFASGKRSDKNSLENTGLSLQ
jgi:hypothetical protein